MPTSEPPPLLLALAGPTSSGKTTLATALSLIFASSPKSNHHALTTNSLFIIHADDFYLPDSKIPTLPSGFQDWDCPEALDISRFCTVLSSIRDGGEIPRDLHRQGGLADGEQGPDTGAKVDFKLVEKAAEEMKVNLDGVHGVKSSPISPQTIAALRHKVSCWPDEAKLRRIVIIEGILLFSPQAPLSTLMSLFDIKILLRTTRAAAKKRREARAGYVTLEGFWQDPPGYFDEVVWPGFMRAYGGLFLGGDVEAYPNQDQVNKSGIELGPLLGDMVQEGGRERDGNELEMLLNWIIDVLGKAIVSPRDTTSGSCGPDMGFHRRLK